MDPNGLVDLAIKDMTIPGPYLNSTGKNHRIHASTAPDAFTPQEQRTAGLVSIRPRPTDIAPHRTIRVGQPGKSGSESHDLALFALFLDARSLVDVTNRRTVYSYIFVVFQRLC